MIFPSTTLLSLVARLAEFCGLAIDLPRNVLAFNLDEEEISEQLQFGRD